MHASELTSSQVEPSNSFSHSAFQVLEFGRSEIHLDDARKRLASSYELISRSQLLIGRLEKLGVVLDRIAQREKS